MAESPRKALAWRFLKLLSMTNFKQASNKYRFKNRFFVKTQRRKV
ncbi:MAG: hypothetical protein Q4F13_11375 [Pseudomonadota bacterium]|nr:hypothetical protein [Pseudomonadota bacterium]